MANILYVVGGRSFTKNNHMRKISEVISVWERVGVKVYPQFGGDIIRSKELKESFGSQNYHDKFYRKSKLFNFLINSLSEFKDILHNERLYKKVKAQFFEKDLNIVWERSSRLHWAGLKLAQSKNIPFVLEWKDHLIDYNYSLFHWFAKKIEIYKIKEANYIVVESNVLKNELITLGVSNDKIYVALNAVNPLEFKRNIKEGISIRNKYNINKNDVVVGYLGSYAFYHNTELLIESACKVLKDKKGVTFLLVGNGKHFKNCKRIANEKGILNKGLIMIDGVAKKEVPKLLSSMDITVLPGSTDIICPIKIMEYMASETVVLAPNYKCNTEVVIDNINGLIFEPLNSIDLSEKINDLIANPIKRKKLSKEAKNYVLNNLTWEKTWGKIILDILEHKKSNISCKDIH
jgi:glycosyltransferase involved in cell wall biosynthesis